MKMKKIVIYLLLALSVFSLSARSPKTKIPKLKEAKADKDQVVIVGKITVKVPGENFKFYAQTWGVTDFSKPDLYIMLDDDFIEVAYQDCREFKTLNNGQYRIFYPDEYFYSVRDIDSSRNFRSKSSVVYCFFSSESFNVNLPFMFEANIPEDVEYAYLGDFEFILEEGTYDCVGIKKTDSFDKAKKELEAKLGKEINLCRVEISLIDVNGKKSNEKDNKKVEGKK